MLPWARCHGHMPHQACTASTALQPGRPCQPQSLTLLLAALLLLLGRCRRALPLALLAIVQVNVPSCRGRTSLGLRGRRLLLLKCLRLLRALRTAG